MSARRPRVGMYWAASCGGCDMSILEIGDHLLDLVERVDIVFWPCVMDFKRHDVETMPGGYIDLCFVNGGIRNEENEDMVRLLRDRSSIMVAHGSCACEGGIPGLANLHSTDSLLDRLFGAGESTVNPSGTIPGPTNRTLEGEAVDLPGLLPGVRTLSQVVDVEYRMPGCPPDSIQTWSVLEAVLGGRLPPPGSVIGAGERCVCDECKLERNGVPVKRFVRPHHVVPDNTHCLLEQGIVCMGPATRSGCRAACISAGMPCRGCYGPPHGVADQGARMVALLGSLVDSRDPDEIRRILDDVVDPVGTFYRFGLPGSSLGRPRR